VDGIVMASANLGAGRAARGGLDTPMVYVGGAFDHPQADLVTSDDEVGSRIATSHLIARGAQRVAMIQGPGDSGLARNEGYRRALADAGRVVDPTLIVRGDWTRQGGHRAMHRLMGDGPPPDAVFCANDLMAIGALDAARELGVDVPGDLSLVGYDDIEAAALLTPALTTVLNPAHAAGEAAGRLLLERLSGTRTERTVLHLTCPLVKRASTTKPGADLARRP
jgi:LacI family transcriptional regulator